MGRKKRADSLKGKSLNDQKHNIAETFKACPFEEKRCYECELLECPEENI